VSLEKSNHLLTAGIPGCPAPKTGNIYNSDGFKVVVLLPFHLGLASLITFDDLGGGNTSDDGYVRGPQDEPGSLDRTNIYFFNWRTGRLSRAEGSLVGSHEQYHLRLFACKMGHSSRHLQSHKMVVPNYHRTVVVLENSKTCHSWWAVAAIRYKPSAVFHRLELNGLPAKSQNASCFQTPTRAVFEDVGYGA
jgi:hypothetical protein